MNHFDAFRCRWHRNSYFTHDDDDEDDEDWEYLGFVSTYPKQIKITLTGDLKKLNVAYSNKSTYM